MPQYSKEEAEHAARERMGVLLAPPLRVALNNDNAPYRLPTTQTGPQKAVQKPHYTMDFYKQAQLG